MSRCVAQIILFIFPYCKNDIIYLFLNSSLFISHLYHFSFLIFKRCSNIENPLKRVNLRTSRMTWRHLAPPKTLHLFHTVWYLCSLCTILVQPNAASLSLLRPPSLPVQLNANIHQSPLHSPLSSSLLCAHACRTVGLIRPLLFTRVERTT